MQTNHRVTQLRLPKNTVDSRAKTYWALNIGISIALVIISLGIMMVIFPGLRGVFGIVLIVGLVLGVSGMLFVPRHLFHYHRWEVTDEAVYASSGWLWREWRIAPLSRIQTVDTEHGPLQQAFGLATVTITTASAAGPIKVSGLSKKTAAELAEKLTKMTQVTREDAT